MQTRARPPFFLFIRRIAPLSLDSPASSAAPAARPAPAPAASSARPRPRPGRRPGRRRGRARVRAGRPSERRREQVLGCGPLFDSQAHTYTHTHTLARVEDVQERGGAPPLAFFFRVWFDGAALPFCFCDFSVSSPTHTIHHDHRNRRPRPAARCGQGAAGERKRSGRPPSCFFRRPSRLPITRPFTHSPHPPPFTCTALTSHPTPPLVAAMTSCSCPPPPSSPPPKPSAAACRSAGPSLATLAR